MTPEDRLQEAIKQVKLAEADDPTTSTFNHHYWTILHHLESQLGVVEKWREEVDDAEVVE